MIVRLLLNFALLCSLNALTAEMNPDSVGSIGTMKVWVDLLEADIRVHEIRPNEEKGGVYFADFELAFVNENGERIALKRVDEKHAFVDEVGSRAYTGTIRFIYPTPKPDLSKIKSVMVSYKKAECIVSTTKNAPK